MNRLRWHLHELLPGTAPAPRTLSRAHVLADLERRLVTQPGTVARLGRELVAHIRTLTETINRLEREIATLVAALAL